MFAAIIAFAGFIGISAHNDGVLNGIAWPLLIAAGVYCFTRRQRIVAS